jgi:WD40 repeat protein
MRRLLAASFVFLCAFSATGYSKPVTSMQLPCESQYQELSPTGNQLVVHCKDRSVHIFNVPEGTERRVFPAEQQANSFAFAQDGSWMAVGFVDGSVEVFPTRGTAQSKRWKPSSRRIDSLYFFPKGSRIAVGPVDSPAQVWDLADAPTQLASLPFEFGGMNACVVSPDEKLLVAAGDDTVVRWYDTATWQKTREFRGFLLETFALSFTPDGKTVLAAGADSRITLMDAATAKPVRELPTEAGSYIVSVDLLGDSGQAATLYLDNAGKKPPHARIWDLGGAKFVAVKTDSPITCGAVVGSKLWVCGSDGKTLTMSQYE